MTREVPGSGAVIEPIFDERFGVRAVNVTKGGSGYDPDDPPRLTVTGCGTPDQEAILYPIIESGRITHVRVLRKGYGYDPLRLQITPEQDTPNVVDSFDINRIWQSHPNSPTSGVFQTAGTPPKKNDRIRIQADNHPKPTPITAEREPGGGPLVDRSFDQTFVYRGGKDVPDSAVREFQKDKVTGILANGGLLHTPDWDTDGGTPVGFSIDTVKYPYVKGATAYDTITENNVRYYSTSKTIDEFALENGVFDWGKFEVFTWNIKSEFDNVMLTVNNVDETLGAVEVGRVVDEIGGNAKGEIAKVVRNSENIVTRVYLRNVRDSFSLNDLCLGANGFTFKVSSDPRLFPNGIFYIDFGPDAEEFGDFAPGRYYFAPENIQVQRNYLIKWNQTDASNQPTDIHTQGHPMQFSTTQDGALNGGTLYYNSTGSSSAPSTDYEDEFNPLFLMNADETNRIYYHCKYHRYMSGFTGDEGYMILSSEVEDEEHENNYYIENIHSSGDQSRHVDGHSKILGMSFDGYPIYGPWGYDYSGAVHKMRSGYRLRTTGELAGARPLVTTASTVTYAVTVDDDEFKFDGSRPAFISLDRGKTYVFNQDDSSNDTKILLLSATEDGWNGGVSGDTSLLYTQNVTYYLDGSAVAYAAYIAGFADADTREVRIEVPVNSPRLLYNFASSAADYGLRMVSRGYKLGDLVEDYIFESDWYNAPLWDGTDTSYAIGDIVRIFEDRVYKATAAISFSNSNTKPTHTTGTVDNWEYLGLRPSVDQHNGKYAVTPEYPNGTYAYFMTEDTSNNPTYPYVIGPKMYGSPIFEGELVPSLPENFPTRARGEVVLNDAGQVAYVRMTEKGDNYFGSANARILGGEGSGATGTPVVQSVTGLSLINTGRDYETPPTLFFEGGGGQGAQGAAEIDTLGKVTGIRVVDEGEFYQEPPYILITGGGGLGAKAVATVDQGVITGITVTDPGEGYVNPPNIIFTKLVNLKRKTRARQAFNSSAIYLTGLVKDLGPSDTTLYVDSTDAYPGSGELIINRETIKYTAKSEGKFTGLTRGVNFKYDQRIILDDGQNDAEGISTYDFNVGDRVIRRIENSGNKVAKVYDWDPSTRELLVTFEVDELAFIDGGIPSTQDAIVQFDAGVAASADSQYQPHVLVEETGENITLLTVPISTLEDRVFEDDDEQDGAGDGIPDLVNTGTAYENQISLDGGIYNSLYGIEETQGGQNTTLFQVGDSVKDASIPFKFATVSTAGGLSDGVEHPAILNITLDLVTGNGSNFSVNEVVTGAISGVRGTVVSWTPATGILVVKDVIPYDTGNVNLGVNGLLYEFSQNSSIVDVVIQEAGTNYSATPTLAFEDAGDIRATGTVNMTTAGDQVASVTITNGGYGYTQSVDSSYDLHPELTFTNDASDTTGSGVAAYAILGGEKLNGNGGASYRIKKIEYQTTVRS